MTLIYIYIYMNDKTMVKPHVFCSCCDDINDKFNMYIGRLLVFNLNYS